MYKVEIERDVIMTLEEFEIKLKRIKNEEVKNQLLKLFKEDQKAALEMYKKELIKHIAKDNENLLKRLANL